MFFKIFLIKLTGLFEEMKTGIHPDVFEMEVVCHGCGKKFKIGNSTLKKMETEVCYNCHPFYTGKQKLVDTAKRIERFKMREEKASK